LRADKHPAFSKGIFMAGLKAIVHVATDWVFIETVGLETLIRVCPDHATSPV
jgi:hypothetical protein